MAKYRYTLTEKQIMARILSGRGQGEREEYRPFIEIPDVPSVGRSHLIRNPVFKRDHHFLSDLEWYNFILRFYEEGSVDWREQFPLSRDITRAIADHLGYKHPRDPRSDADAIVMTTDLVVTYEGPNGEYLVAYSVKYKKDQKKKRVIEKLAIERQYWEEQGVEFHVINEEDIPSGISSTGKFLISYYSLATCYQREPKFFQRLANAIVRTLPKEREDLAFTEFMQKLDKRAGFDLGTHLTVGLHLLARGVLSTNFEVDEIQFVPLTEIRVTTLDFAIC